jgi:AcrR family transcriptional regulator
MSVTKQKSESVPKRSDVQRKDERVRRTRMRIGTAFVALLHRRAYGDIRVTDIARKAGVGRPTFYAHYATKDNLLRAEFERVVAPMLVPVSGRPASLDATRYFEHVCSSKFLYKAFMGPNGGTAPRVLRDCFEARAREALSLHPSADSILRQSASARLIACAIIVLVECWLELGARETPEQLQSLFADLVSKGLCSSDRA